MSELNIDLLAEKWAQAKDKEDQARLDRLAIESTIVDWLGQPEEGTNKVHGDLFSLKVTGKVTRSVDFEALKSADPQAFSTVCDVKYGLNLRQYRAVLKANPAMANTVQQFMTEKPAKPSFQVEYIGKEDAAA